MSQGPTYLDAASSEPLHPAARETLMAALDAGFADVRRLHGSARNARLLLDNARAVVAEGLGVRPDEVTFTSSGTDAVHRGLLGLALAQPGSRRHLVCSAIEHSAVLHAARWWESVHGGTWSLAAVDARGQVTDAPNEADVVAWQHANHEVGTVADLSRLRRGLAEDTPLFVDACASMGRLPLPAEGDVVAGSAHKWGGPAGVGVLVVRSRRWVSPFPDDDRADHRGSGFENVPAALAAAAALQAVVAEREERSAREHALVDRIREHAAGIPDVDVVGDPVDRLPHLVTFSVLYAHGEQLVSALDRRGFGVASGSACTASALEPSHVLAAMGALTHGNVRVSLTRDTTADDVDRFLAALDEAVAEVRA